MIEKAKQNMIINKIEKALPPFLEKFFEEMEPHLKGQLKTFVADVRNLYKQAFHSAVQSPRRVFEKRKKQAAADFLKSREERMSIAKDSRKIREEQIRPLRKLFQEFVVRVENCLAEKEPDVGGKEKFMEDFSLNMDNTFDDGSLLSPFSKG
jgi:hypothetical protein